MKDIVTNQHFWPLIYSSLTLTLHDSLGDYTEDNTDSSDIFTNTAVLICCIDKQEKMADTLLLLYCIALY